MRPPSDDGRRERALGTRVEPFASTTLALVTFLLLSGAARAENAPSVSPGAPAPPPAAGPVTASPAAAAEAPGATPAPVVAPAAPEAAPPAERVGPVPTADAVVAASDHDLVVGHLGIEARRFDPGPIPLALRPAFGCPAVETTLCQVTLGALGIRYWSSRHFAWNGGLVLGAGGGRDSGQSLDTYLGVGPVVGVTILVGNWRHFAIGASPELAVVWFRPGPSGMIDSTTMVSLRAALEGELHFGFVGVPALSIGLVTGLGLQYESGPSARVWSVGVLGAESAWGMLTNLFVRYYL